jgi:hypothetical protein
VWTRGVVARDDPVLAADSERREQALARVGVERPAGSARDRGAESDHAAAVVLPQGGGLGVEGLFESDPNPIAAGGVEDLEMRLFRERLLRSLLDQHAIAPELVQRLLAWRHPGFSAHGWSISTVGKRFCIARG